MANWTIPYVAVDVPALGIFEVLIPSWVWAGEAPEPRHVEASLHMAGLGRFLRQLQRGLGRMVISMNSNQCID